MKSQSIVVVRYQETDQMGIAHHSVYPVWFEVARTDFIKALGLPYSVMEKKGVMLPLTELRACYHKDAFYEDELVVTARLTRLSAAKAGFLYTVERKSDGQLIATGETVHGIVDSGAFRPINLKKKHPEMFELLSESMEDER